ncbi:MAG: thiamine pyrophosphate-binding protein [Chloroflexota bacterium]
MLAEYLVHRLKELGVRHVFGVTGHSIFQITDAIFREPGIEFVPTQSELAAAYMAEGYARAGRQLGVCLVSVGPGAANVLGGVAHALKEGTPLLVISSDVNTKVAGKPANWHEIGQQQMLASVTKRSATLRAPDDLPAELAAAIETAYASRGGPVFLGIPVDMLSPSPAAEGQGWREGAPAIAPDARSPRATKLPESALDGAAAALKAAQAPVIIAGEGVYWSGAEAETLALAEALQATFGTPYSQKGLLNENHPLSLGVIGSGAAPYANQFCLDSDLIIALGVSFGEGLTLGYGHRVIPEGARILQIGGDATGPYPLEISMVADIGATIRSILERLPSGKRAVERVAKLAAAKAAWREEIASYADSDGPIDYWSIQSALREAIADDTIVVGAVTERMLQRFVATSKVFHTGDFRAIGHGLATAMGVKFACPARQVVCLSGDGSFMMELPELATLARNRLPIPVLVVHNNAYGSMKHDQLRLFGGRFIGTDLHTPDFCQVAGPFGIATRRVDARADLANAIREVIALQEPALLDIVCPVEGL